MARKTRSTFRVNGAVPILTDRDWITVFAALLHDSDAESRQLAGRLMANSKQGRQIRLARMIRDTQPTLKQMAQRLKVSRRTIFRYLNGLEEQGLRLHLDENNAYRLQIIPRRYKRLL